MVYPMVMHATKKEISKNANARKIKNVKHFKVLCHSICRRKLWKGMSINKVTQVNQRVF